MHPQAKSDKGRTVRKRTNWQICLVKSYSLIAKLEKSLTRFCPTPI